MGYSFNQRLSHFFHVVSNIRPIVWICLYVCAAPLFALIYWALPDGQFRIPDNSATDFGSWFYYSIVTITTLGFGDYTPAHGAAQAVTAVEVMCGLIFLGLFLNAVGSMKSEIDVASEIEKQKEAHLSLESEKLLKNVPALIHTLNTFLAYCYAVTTPSDKREETETKYNPQFTFKDLRGLFEPTGLPFDPTKEAAVVRLLQSSSQTSLVLDSLQQRIDLSLWPRLLEDCFSFVANWQMFSHADILLRNMVSGKIQEDSEEEKRARSSLEKKIYEWEPSHGATPDKELQMVAELETFIKENASIAIDIETEITQLAMARMKENKSSTEELNPKPSV